MCLEFYHSKQKLFWLNTSIFWSCSNQLESFCTIFCLNNKTINHERLLEYSYGLLVLLQNDSLWSDTASAYILSSMEPFMLKGCLLEFRKFICAWPIETSENSRMVALQKMFHILITVCHHTSFIWKLNGSFAVFK